MVLVVVGSSPTFRPFFAGDVAQLVRVLACRASGRGFEPRHLRMIPYEDSFFTTEAVNFLPYWGIAKR